MTTSQRLKELRLEKNYSQDYIAHEMGICQKTYSNLESGKSKIDINHLDKLSKIYDITTADLINPYIFSQNGSTIKNHEDKSSPLPKDEAPVKNAIQLFTQM